MGYKRFALGLYTHPKEFQELMESMRKKYMEAFSIIAESPADIVHCDDNVNAAVTSPQLFERFLLPYYNDATKILHKAGKLFEAHMDGKLRALKDLIAKTDIDIIEAFTPPPMGDLHVREARESWREKAILVNFPGSVWHLGEETIRKVTIDILRETAPGDGFLIGVTEWIPESVKATGLRTITDVLWKYGKHLIAIP